MPYETIRMSFERPCSRSSSSISLEACWLNDGISRSAISLPWRWCILKFLKISIRQISKLSDAPCMHLTGELFKVATKWSLQSTSNPSMHRLPEIIIPVSEYEPKLLSIPQKLSELLSQPVIIIVKCKFPTANNDWALARRYHCQRVINLAQHKANLRSQS